MPFHPYQVANTFEMNILENSNDSTANLEYISQMLRSLLAELPPGLYFGTVEFQSLEEPSLSLRLSQDSKFCQLITLPTFSKEDTSLATSPSSISKRPTAKRISQKSSAP